MVGLCSLTVSTFSLLVVKLFSCQLSSVFSWSSSLYAPSHSEYFIFQVTVPLIAEFPSTGIISFSPTLLLFLFSQVLQDVASICWSFQYDYPHEWQRYIIINRLLALNNMRTFYLFMLALLILWFFVFCPSCRLLLFVKLDDESSSSHGDFQILFGNIRKMSIPVCSYTLQKSKRIQDDIWTILMVVLVCFMLNLLS